MEIFNSDLNMLQSKQLEHVIIECYEDISDYMIIQEKTKISLSERIKSFFMDLRIQIENLITEIRVKCASNTRKKENLKELKQKYSSAVAVQKYTRNTTISMIDLWTYKEVYKEMNNELWRYAKKFSKVEYKHVSEIEEDLNRFESVVNQYSEKLKKLSDNPIEVDVKKAIAFYEDEMTGRSFVLKTLEESMDEFQEMQANALNLQNRTYRYGSDILPKHINFIRKMVLNITNKINKAAVKFIVALNLIV